MTQGTLFTGPATARKSDPDTSHEAARRFEQSGKAEIQRKKVFRGVVDFPGRTSAELSPLVGLDRYAVARRLPELEKSGSVRKGQPRICSAHGTAAVTWWRV